MATPQLPMRPLKANIVPLVYGFTILLKRETLNNIDTGYIEMVRV